MRIGDKIDQLRNRIYEALGSNINRDYWLLEVPFYSNVGDTLIWQGEMDFLKGVDARCRGMHSLETFRFPKLDKDDLILFQGGGNFGDLWPRHHDFKMKVVEAYPDNEFIFLPQTIYFENPENMRQCASFLSGKRVTICVRDKVSQMILKKHFNNEVLLVPDMAFCIDMGRWRSSMGTATRRRLLLKREDKELLASDALNGLEAIGDIDIADWITFRGDNVYERIFNRLRRLVNRRPMRETWVASVTLGLYMRYIYRPFLIRSGIQQLSQYGEIYTTRLHAGILGLLLDKHVKFLDNSYGKNRNFYATWLEDCDGVEFLG